MTIPSNDTLFGANKILVLAPHPDDESLGCGGVLALYAGMAKEVCVAVISKGDAVNVRADNIVNVRKQETNRAAEILQVKHLVFMDFVDTGLNKSYDAVKEALRGLIQTFRPDIVFAPSPMDVHEDHVTVSKITMGLLRELGSFAVAFYEIYSPIRYNCIVDITDVFDIKKRAVMCYHFSLLEKPENILFAMEGLNAYRSFDFVRKGYFEAYYVITAGDTEDVVIDWLTHGLSKDASSYKFLSQLKKVDQLLSAYQESLKRTDLLKEGGKGVGQLNDMPDATDKETPIRVEDSCGKIKEALFPRKTIRRELYEAVMKRIKSRH